MKSRMSVYLGKGSMPSSSSTVDAISNLPDGVGKPGCPSARSVPEAYLQNSASSGTARVHMSV